MSGDVLALASVAVIAMATAARRGSRNPDLIRRMLDGLGLEIGDYGRGEMGFLVLVDDDDAYQIKLEGWGQECVAGTCPIKRERATAEKRAKELATTWEGEGFGQTGWERFDDPEVWALTWGLRGPLDHAVADQFDSDDVMDLR